LNAGMLISCRLHFTVKFIYRYIENGDIDRDVGDTRGVSISPHFVWHIFMKKLNVLHGSKNKNMIVWLTNGKIICFETKIHFVFACQIWQLELNCSVHFENLTTLFDPLLRRWKKTYITICQNSGPEYTIF
jgi:hypothetical protein